MKETSSVVYLKRNRPDRGPVVKAGKYEKAVSTCRGILFQTLDEAMREFFAQVDDDLFKLAENSTSNSQQTIFFDAMRSIRLMQKTLEPEYLQLIEDAFQTFWNGGTILSAKETRVQEEQALSLVEKDELEEELAVTTMVNKANDNFHRDLAAINARFIHMLGKGDLPLEANPVSPALLAAAFKEALEQWDAEVLARIVVYKCFDRTVLSRMGSCYRTMNRFLIEEGVLPELRYPGEVRSQGGGGAHGGGGAPANGGGATDSTVVGEGEESGGVPSLDQIWKYLQQLGAAAALHPLPLPANPQLPVMPRSVLMESLGRLQNQVLADDELEGMDAALLQEYLRQQLMAVLGSGAQGEEKQRVGEPEKRTIDMILALFNHVLEDPNLPDPMRALIARLQIPVLKVAITDPGFLRDDAHPARKLIDELAEASMGWRDDGDRSEKSLYHQVKRAVERIIHEYDQDVALFEEVRAEFGAWMAKRERVRKIMEQRLAQAVSGEEQLTVAKMEVNKLLGSLKLDTLPEAAKKILTGPWKKLLTILWLREGDDGQNWKKAVGIARLMEKYLSSSRRGSFRRDELLAEIPEIIGGLKKGFAYISLDQKKSARLLNGLQGCFIEALRPLPSQPSVVEETASEEEEAAAAREPEREPDEFDQTVATIAEGTWVRLLPAEGEEGEPLVCKLVWRSKYTGTMVFVDGQGNKAAQLKEEALAQIFREGRGALLEEAQAPLIDRAIRKMMRVLNAEIVGLRLKMAD